MSDLTQLIDFDGNFSPCVEEWIEHEGFKSKGFNFSVVTVLGCQSSGKSTLLNQLFGTTFEVMDATQGRNQTTKGLWLGRDKEDATMIIDVEGTDSKERGEDRLTFEHRASLFSLALADVVMVNMWYHDLGRYTASNYGLLKTVLGVNLELFQQQKDAPKTTMLFVIRDYSEAQTPLDKLTQMIQTDIRQIWKETSKPEHLLDSVADDFFVFKTVGLPSKFAEPSKFLEKAEELRSLWLKDCRPKSYTRQIPADGFAFYAKNVWETILRSSELDIPSQKEMLATYRCEELKNAALSEVLAQLPEFLLQAQRGELSMEDYGWARKVVERALELYDGPASRYERVVFLKKREQLLQTLQTELQKIIETHLTHIRHRIAKDASNGLNLIFCANAANSDIVGGMPRLECWAQFAESADRWRSDSLKVFDDSARCLQLQYVRSDTGETMAMMFDAAQARQALLEALEATLLRMREKQLQSFSTVLADLANEKLGDVDIHLTKLDLSPDTFWTAMSATVQKTRDEILEELGDAWLGLQPSQDAQFDLWHVSACEGVVKALRAKLERICEWLQNQIYNRFQQFFDQDEQGAPRQWQELTSDKIRDLYLKARDKGLVVLQIFEHMKIDLEKIGIDSPVVDKLVNTPLLSESKKHQVLERATRQMQKACQEAQLIQTTGGRGANVPWWMWGLLLAFGYNEIALLLFSPVSLILVIVGLLVGAICYYSGNLQLPVQLFRHIAAMFATTMVTMLGTLQEAPRPVAQARDIKQE